MPKPYLPKIKMKTVFSTAQKMGATAAGKQISQTAFKNFLKQDKDLKKFAYSAPTSSVTKQNAQKFFGHVASKIAQQKNLKLSYFAKKELGVKVGPGGTVNETAMNKVYQTAVGEEVKQMEPKGPDPEEIARQEKRKEAFQTLRKRETADEIRKEQQAQDKGAAPGKTAGSSRPVQIQGGAGTSAFTKPQVATGLADKTTAQKSVTSGKSVPAKIAVLPLDNLSQNKSLDMVAQKLTTTLSRIIGSYKKFDLVEKSQLEKIVATSGYSAPQKIINLDTAKEIQNRLNADFIVMGDLQKMENQTQIQIKLLKKGEAKPIKIAEVKKETEDVFELERHLGWCISNYFEALPQKIKEGKLEEKLKAEDVEIPPPSKAEDLPI